MYPDLHSVSQGCCWLSLWLGFVLLHILGGGGSDKDQVLLDYHWASQPLGGALPLYFTVLSVVIVSLDVVPSGGQNLVSRHTSVLKCW